MEEFIKRLERSVKEFSIKYEDFDKALIQIEKNSINKDHNTQIDKYITEMMELLDELDIIVTNSCQDNLLPGYIYIEFGSLEDLEKFLALVNDNGIPSSWKLNYEVLFKDEMYDLLEGDETVSHLKNYKNTFTNEDIHSICYSIRFPSDEYKYVMELLSNQDE